MTASWVRNRAQSLNLAPDSDVPQLCQFYETFEKEGNDADIPLGVYDLDQLKELGRHRGWCPYFLTRRVFINSAQFTILLGNQSCQHYCLQLSIHARSQG
jgi:DNA excision repair protein ERCC-2